MIRDGVRVAITGRVNAGKSSLLNCLVGCDRALVHKTPGTTRDVVEEVVNLEGAAFRLRDTAGVRHSGCEVEAMGMKVARREIEQADIVLVVFDGSQKFGEEDQAVLSDVRDKRTVVVVNKADLPMELDVSCIGNRLGGAQPLFVSALTGGEAGWLAAGCNSTGTCKFNCVADINGDGLVNTFDIDPFVACLTGG